MPSSPVLGQARLFGKFFEKLPVLKEREKSRKSCQSPPAGGEPSAGGATVLFRESVTSLNKSSIVAKEKPFRRNRAFFCPRDMTGELSPASATEPLNKSCDILINQVFGKAAALAREHIFEKFSKSCQSFQEKFERKVASDMKKILPVPSEPRVRWEPMRDGKTTTSPTLTSESIVRVGKE